MIRGGITGFASRRVAPAREPPDEHLAAVLDRRVAAGHVAVERRVADRHLALVAGRQHHAMRLVRDRHQQHAAAARLDVLLGRVGLAVRELFRERGRRSPGTCPRSGSRVTHPERVRHRGRVLGGHGRRVPRGHHHGVDARAAQRIAGEREHERGIDAARKAEHHAREAVLAHVVADAEDERPPDALLAEREPRNRAAREADTVARRLDVETRRDSPRMPAGDARPARLRR